MKRFKSPRQVQRFLSAYDQVTNVFPAAETTTAPQTSGPAALRPSPPGPTSPASPWLQSRVLPDIAQPIALSVNLHMPS